MRKYCPSARSGSASSPPVTVKVPAYISRANQLFRCVSTASSTAFHHLCRFSLYFCAADARPLTGPDLRASKSSGRRLTQQRL
nr:MAG TPA: hypothetical protein [Caudoviricetes sp.]